MNIHNLAQDAYIALCDNAAAEAAIRKEYADMALSMATDGNFAFEITSSTINGKSYAGTRSMTNADRFKMLSIIVAMFDVGGVISSKATPIF